MKTPGLTVCSALVRDDQGRIEYKQFHAKGKEHFHLRVWLEGDDAALASIERVEYVLHPSFRKPARESTKRGTGFAIDFWTWGMFDIHVTIVHTNGELETTNYYLRYELPDDNGQNYAKIPTGNSQSYMRRARKKR